MQLYLQNLQSCIILVVPTKTAHTQSRTSSWCGIIISRSPRAAAGNQSLFVYEKMYQKVDERCSTMLKNKHKKNTHHQPKYIKIEKIPLPPFQFSFFLFSFPRRPPLHLPASIQHFVQKCIEIYLGLHAVLCVIFSFLVSRFNDRSPLLGLRPGSSSFWTFFKCKWRETLVDDVVQVIICGSRQ